MPQLSLLVFYDAVIVSILFVSVFVFFLRAILPLLSFFSKKNKYLSVCLFRELCAEPTVHILNKHTISIIHYGNTYIRSVCSRYANAKGSNVLFYGVYPNDIRP